MLYEFHVILFPGPGEALNRRDLQWQGLTVRALPESPGPCEWKLTFDEAAEGLSPIPSLFFEPDGSFVWKIPDEPAGQQIDGQLHDRGPALDSIELKGRCEKRHFDRLLSITGWPQQNLTFQFCREGFLVTEDEFRRLMECQPYRDSR